MSVIPRSPAALEVVVRIRATGRAQLFLAGARAPKSGPTIDTATSPYPRSGPILTCRAGYEPRPAGTYTWRVRRVSGAPAPVPLTVRG